MCQNALIEISNSDVVLPKLNGPFASQYLLEEGRGKRGDKVIVIDYLR
jgi:hypothetical protein